MADLVAHLDQIVGQSPLQFLPDPFSEPVPIHLYLKRDDLLHPLVSGNKWRKLKYNLIEAERLGYTTLLTFGGAYSNHLYATAAAGRVFGFKTIGIVRGDELAKKPLNPTLTFCREQGMVLHFVDRATYLRAEEADFQQELQVRYGPCYRLPEGGTNDLAIRGAAEIMPELRNQLDRWPDTVACAVGTGGTLAGLLLSAPESVHVLGMSALKVPDGRNAYFAGLPEQLPPNVSIRTDFHQGGYARTTPALRQFMLDFERKTGVLLDHVYTGKLLFALYTLACQGYFSEGATVVAIHTGGLQGRNG
ncbi:1-aminocyclopropane-1-carboxylate deaminase/D-cysteine desulfhydrase [Fibrella forsythiae]|uniref:1-aminocyclopropane-1-carboxylate deaminase/D-cysteine desulfhydrase n=1 Tax=Fibrella forsythiae TaxID=2817061 RepID=A0ABS3JBP1_9BACT|nr:pyridoxal-phosphate dependent enzyme [Fibrella forsythiae]MBO0947412.1 1-aminocyclopropane-1-carboxylate deaminase/D-cysteine desulfhydrase [Fibrella forsythiae]